MVCAFPTSDPSLPTLASKCGWGPGRSGRQPDERYRVQNFQAGCRARGWRKNWRPTCHLSTAGSNHEILVPTGWLGERGQNDESRRGITAGLRPAGRARHPSPHKTYSYYTVLFGAAPKIFRGLHSGDTNTWTGLVRNASLLPSIRWPSQSSAKAAGMSSSATMQCHQTTITDEKPTGMAILCKARLTGWLCASS